MAEVKKSSKGATTAPDYVVKDMSLAVFGRKEIELAEKRKNEYLRRKK